MNGLIKLLPASLLNDKDKLRELTYWLRVMNRPNGWHYDLDHIWILNELEAAGLAKGATIIDAGAGQGIMQYLLAARGYNIISVDFSPRTPPFRAVKIFTINGDGESKIKYKHPYMSFISYSGDSDTLENTKFGRFNLRKVITIPKKLLRRAISCCYFLYERFLSSHKNYGSITYLRAPFHDIPLEAQSVDAIISVSAIEHSDIDLFVENIQELLRLLKPNSAFLLTTSATESKENKRHEKSSGWCFSLEALRRFFPDFIVEFHPKECESALVASKVFIGRLDPYYYEDKDSFCYKKQVLKLPYLPLSIKIMR